MTNQGPPEPDETRPFTHQPYGTGPGEVPPGSPPADQSPQWPSYDPSGGSDAEHPPADQPPNPYGAPPPYSQPGYGQGGYPPPAQPPGYGTPGYGYGAPGYAVPGYSYVSKNSTATTSMVLGIIALVSLFATPFCCITLPGMLTGPFAIWTGVKARREIDQHPGYFGNRGQAVAGLVTGIIATALGVLLILAVVLFFGFADWNGSYDDSMY